jgi:hypothetical protein
MQLTASGHVPERHSQTLDAQTQSGLGSSLPDPQSSFVRQLGAQSLSAAQIFVQTPPTAQ